MTYNSYFKCSVCGTVFRLRFQVGYTNCPVAFACPECLTEINGIITVNQVPPSISFSVDNAKEVGLPKGSADYMLELSSEFLTRKMARDEKKNYLSPFLRNVNFSNMDKTREVLENAEDIEKRLNSIKIIRDLYNNGKYDYAEKMLKDKNDPVAAQLNNLADIKTGHPEIDSLSHSHRYVLFSIESALAKDTFSSICSIADSVEKLLTENSDSMFQFSQCLGEGGYLDENRQKLENLIVRFVGFYRQLLPLYMLGWDLKNVDLSAEGITTVRLQPLHEFYKDAFETICNSIDVAIGLNNIAVRKEHESFPDGHFPFQEKMKKYGSKYTKEKSLVVLEPFSFPFVSLLDNTIRNSESHFSSKYDVLSQVVTFKDSKKEEKMYLIEFASHCFEAFCSACILWELVYQVERIYLISKIKTD